MKYNLSPARRDLLIELLCDNIFEHRFVCIYYQGDEEPCKKFDLLTCNCCGDIRECEKMAEVW